MVTTSVNSKHTQVLIRFHVIFINWESNTFLSEVITLKALILYEQLKCPSKSTMIGYLLRFPVVLKTLMTFNVNINTVLDFKPFPFPLFFMRGNCVHNICFFPLVRNLRISDITFKNNYFYFSLM